MDNINSHINVKFYYLSNKTNQRFVAITVLELKAKIFKKSKKSGKKWLFFLDWN